ncbi:hypothetical protein CURTO8I2_220217 [Curtobacterium sp. 8I-2]|nr:hypothetical protein CURTO8I2_220217 [Curtobacterium sp. 8I-2]
METFTKSTMYGMGPPRALGRSESSPSVTFQSRRGPPTVAEQPELGGPTARSSVTARTRELAHAEGPRPRSCTLGRRAQILHRTPNVQHKTLDEEQPKRLSYKRIDGALSQAHPRRSEE